MSAAAPPQALNRVLVVGCGGAGKSTLAARIAARTGLPLIHLDALYWQPGWQEPAKEAWSLTVAQALSRDAWVMDGNYGGTFDARLAACDAVVFLDRPRWLCLWRVIRRRMRYHRHVRPDMGAGCPEQLTLESLRYVWRYPRDRRSAMLQRLTNAQDMGKQVFVLRSQATIDAFVAGWPGTAR